MPYTSTRPSRAEPTPSSKAGTVLTEQVLWSPGSVIREKYRIVQRVGLGGMATVYQAEHLHFREIYALKVINPNMVHDEALVERFMREAFLTRKLRHPHAVRVDDIDRAEDGSPFMVMEFLAGQTLYEVMHYEGPLPYNRVRTLAGHVASALHAAHEIGIIHRDIKPANITIVKTPTGDQAKVLDFGIAKLKEAKIDHAFENDYTLSVAGMVVGTPAYVSPEQAIGKRGSELDARSDVYSFAVLVYQMLTNKLPVNADSEEQFVVAHATVQPDDIRLHLSDLPPSVASLIMRCLSKDPQDRPWDPRELTNEMDKWDRPDQQPAAPPPMPAPAAPRRPMPSWIKIAFTCAGLLLLLAAVALFRSNGSAADESTTEPTSEILSTYLTLPTGDMILIPNGGALLGEHDHVQPVHAFYIDKTEVSTRAYSEFCQKTHRSMPPDIPLTELDLPIRNVTYQDAAAFAAWAHKRLPTAAEWEKAARGTQGQHFPWGNDLGTGMARLPASPEEAQASSEPAPIDSFPQGASSYGVLNMVGNVWEWVATNPAQIRGGSYRSYPPAANQSFEALVYAGETVAPNTRRADIGFRCAR